MKKLMGIILLVLVMLAVSPLHLGNAYLRTSRFDTVTVVRGENVWLIAERYAKKADEVPEVAEAIIEVNSLDSEARIREGQQLRIPVIK